MPGLVDELSMDELTKMQEFLGSLKEADREHVRKVIKLVDVIATTYFNSGEHHSNYGAFRGGTREQPIQGQPFFGVYLIGGNLTKEGERPDIDLLVATNMRWSNGFHDEEEGKYMDEPFWCGLKEDFGDVEIIRETKMPNNYNLGITKGKTLICLDFDEAGKPIDICYVRSMRCHNGEFGREYVFISEEQFIEKDVDKEGRPLERAPLYRKTNTAVEGRTNIIGL